MPTPADTRFGSARWAEEEDIARAGLWNAGMPFGYFEGRLLRYNGDSPRILLAGSGSGKFTSMLTLPLCLPNAQNICMHDPKGEGWAVTTYRLAEQGIRAYNWNPKRLNGQPSHSINPLDHLTPDSPNLFTDISTLCESLLPFSGGGSAKFFELSSRSVLSALMIHHVRTQGRISFVDVFSILNTIVGPIGPWVDLLEAMQNSSDPYVSTKGHAIAQEALDAPKQWAAIVAELNAYMNWLNDPQLRESLRGGDMSLSEMIGGRYPVRLHLSEPGDLAAFFAPIIRVFFDVLITLKSRAPQAPSIMLIVDEAALLGRFEALKRAMTFGRGAGIQTFPVLQDLGQLRDAFGPTGPQTFLGNSALQIWFGIQDYESAKYLSDAIGSTSLRYDDPRQQAEAAHQRNTQVTDYLHGGDPIEAARNYHHYSEVAGYHSTVRRPLITADEIMAMPRDEMIVILPGHPPIRANRIPYFENPDLAGRYGPNPYHPPMNRVLVQGRWRSQTLSVRKIPVPRHLAHFPQYQNATTLQIEGYPL